MAIPELTLLDGRYQIIRQLGGQPRTPLMVASDLSSGRVVCIRLQSFNTALATLASVPALAREGQVVGDAPLLPYDFGVDQGTAYTVREFVTATNLEQRLATEQPPAVEVLSVLRRGGEALLVANDQGFTHPDLQLRHFLIAADGAVRVSGYDRAPEWGTRRKSDEGAMLAALLPAAFAGVAPGELPAAVRSLLTRRQTWQATTTPELATVVRHLRRCEDHLRGYRRSQAALAATARMLASLFRRLRHLGPLLHPYLVVLALVAAIGVLAVRALAAPADPGKISVYRVPTRVPADAAGYSFANPPQVAVTAVKVTEGVVATTASTVTTAQAVGVPLVAEPSGPAAVTSSPQRPAVVNAPPTHAATPYRAAPPSPLPQQRASGFAPAASVARTVTTATHSAPPPVAAVGPSSTVIITHLTAQQTTARVTVIGATSDHVGAALATSSHVTLSTATTTVTALHAVATTSQRAAEPVTRATTAATNAAVTKVVAVLR